MKEAVVNGAVSPDRLAGIARKGVFCGETIAEKTNPASVLFDLLSHERLGVCVLSEVYVPSESTDGGRTNEQNTVAFFATEEGASVLAEIIGTAEFIVLEQAYDGDVKRRGLRSFVRSCDWDRDMTRRVMAFSLGQSARASRRLKLYDKAQEAESRALEILGDLPPFTYLDMRSQLNKIYEREAAILPQPF